MGERVSWPLVVTLLFIGVLLGGCAMLVVQQHPASATTTTTPCPRPALHTCIEPVKYPGTSPRPSVSSAPTAPRLPVTLPKTGGG